MLVQAFLAIRLEFEVSGGLIAEDGGVVQDNAKGLIGAGAKRDTAFMRACETDTGALIVHFNRHFAFGVLDLYAMARTLR